MNSYGMTKKDIINAETSSIALQTLENGAVIEIRGAAVTETADMETGEARNVGYMACTDGQIYGCVSATAIKSIEGIVDLFTDEAENGVDKLNVKVIKRKSNAGREFISLLIM